MLLFAFSYLKLKSKDVIMRSDLNIANFFKKYRKRIIALVTICAILAGAGVFFYHSIFDKIDTAPCKTFDEETVVDVNDAETLDVTYSDDFTIRSVSLWTDTQDGNAEGSITTTAYDSSGRKIAELQLPYLAFSNNSYSTVLNNFTYKATKDNPLKISMVFKQTSTTPLKIKMSPDKTADVTVSGEAAGQNRSLHAGFFLIFSLVSLAVLLAFILPYCFKTKFFVTFLVVTGLLLIAYTIVLPINSAPDEDYHYMQGYRLSDWQFGINATDDNIPMRSDDYKTIQIISQNPTKENYIKIFAGIGRHADDTQLVDVKARHGSWNGPSCWFSSLGITISRVAGFNGITTFYFARFFNLLFYLLLCTLAVAIAPVRKGFFAIASILPMALNLGSSASYDVEMYPMAFLIVACWLYFLCREQKIPIWKWVLFSIPVLLLAPCKTYIFICFLPIFIPTRKFGSRLKSILCKTIQALLSVALFIIETGGFADKRINNVFEGRFTASHLLANIGQSLMITGNSLVVNKGTWSKWLLGSTLGPLTVGVDDLWIFMFCIFLVIASFWTKEEYDKMPERFGKYKMPIAAICLLVFGGIIYAGFAWSYYNAESVRGIQGRYFLPLLPLLMLLGMQKNIITKKLTDTGLFLSGTMVSAFILFEIFASRF